MSVEGVEHGLQRAAETFRVGVRWQLGGEKEKKKRQRERDQENFLGNNQHFLKRQIKRCKKVKNSHQPIYKGHSNQWEGISRSFNGIWLEIQLSQALGWWCVFAGRQNFGFCLREHLKQGGSQDPGWSVHTLFF